MNSQANLLNPSYSLRESKLSMGKRQDQPLLYATSQVNAFPNNSQKPYFVTSTFVPHQINNSFQAQQLAASRLQGPKQPPISNSQIYSPNLYQNIQGLKQKPQSQSRITYHPYVRTYIDYEERVVLVPIEKVKVNYYEKIIETTYVPHAIEEIVTETVAVEKEEMKIRYIPVEQKIIHFPKEEKQPTPSGQQEKRVIYVDNPQKSQASSQAKNPQSPSGNINTLIASFQQNLNSNSQPAANLPSATALAASKANEQQHQINTQTIIADMPFEQEQEQIVLDENLNAKEKLLGQSHVKEVYKPSYYNPSNEPTGNF